jgi:hypothetical protein
MQQVPVDIWAAFPLRVFAPSLSTPFPAHAAEGEIIKGALMKAGLRQDLHSL